MSILEIAANLITALSIWLAARNSVHTWSTGIVGCVLFGIQFFETQLYADATLQLFFIATSAMGWWNWKRAAGEADELPIRSTPGPWLAQCLGMAIAAALGYGWLLKHFTDAWSPFVDSVVLTFSVLAQLLLMGRRIENWPCWLIVNTLAVPLYAARGLHLTSALYAFFWLNAIYSYFHWRRLSRLQKAA
jgi:nicotinamide mononucleotide transporter